MLSVPAAGGPGRGYEAMLAAAYVVWAIASFALALATSGLLWLATRGRPRRRLAWYLLPVFSAFWGVSIRCAVIGRLPFERPPVIKGPMVDDVPSIAPPPP